MGMSSQESFYYLSMPKLDFVIFGLRLINTLDSVWPLATCQYTLGSQKPPPKRQRSGIAFLMFSFPLNGVRPPGMESECLFQRPCISLWHVAPFSSVSPFLNLAISCLPHSHRLLAIPRTTVSK